MKIYHTPTQEAYTHLMKTLKKEGYRWSGVRGGEITIEDLEEAPTEHTCICLNEDNKNIGLATKEFFQTDQTYAKIKIETYMPQEKTLETLEVGDLIVDEYGIYRRILMAQGEGEARCYALSEGSDDLDSTYLKEGGYLWTAYELKDCGHKPYIEEPKK